MSISPQGPVAVVGAGTMGNGIAHVFALHGFRVTLLDLSPEALQRAQATIAANLERQVTKNSIGPEQRTAALANLSLVPVAATPQQAFGPEAAAALGHCQLVVEAVAENPDIKTRLFAALDAHTPPACILASNTSSISITRLAAATRRPGQVIGMHFMNPVPVMKLVEVIRGHDTTDATLASVEELARQLGKTPVAAHDYPGFVSNRILMPMINEAFYALWQGVATAEAIDGIMKLGMAHPMGPLTLADFIGLDVCVAILRVLHEGFGDAKYAPCPLLVNLVQAGHLGRKTGRGVYVY